MQKITPFLWFDGKAEGAAKFYTSIFKNSKIVNVSPLSAIFLLAGQKFLALNGGFKEYFQDGAPACLGKYRHGDKVGEWRICDPKDKLIKSTKHKSKQEKP